MKILSWNCRGLGDPRTVQELTRLVRLHKPKIVFLSETRKNKIYVENLHWRLGLKYVVTFNEQGKGGGLALFWDESVDVRLFKIGNRVVDVTIYDMPKEINWRCSFVYGEPRTHLRHHMWCLLKRIKPLLNGPWLMLGDFNEAMWQSEHLSATRRNEKQMMIFREALSFCDLHDLGFTGTPWTFDNKQMGNRNVRVRLDRAVACPVWSSIFPTAQVSHLVSPRSDHCPIL
jgi:exonuclease III